MPGFTPGQRVHHATDPTRTGTVHYTGPVQGHAGDWVGVDWDNGAGKHDGSVNGVRYFQAKGEKSGSFVREGNLRGGVGVVEAVRGRYRGEATKKEDEDEMYVLSASNNRVSVQFVGKDKIQDKLSRFDELERVSLAYLGVSFAGSPNEISKFVPSLKELDLTGNLLSDWNDVGAICEELPALAALNLSNNLMSSDVPSLLPLRNLSVLVLNYTGIKWAQIESLKGSLAAIKELHLMGNQISEITPASLNIVQGFDSLRVLNLEENCISEWDEILKLSELASLEQLHLNKNSLHSVFYHCNKRTNESLDRTPFKQLSCLLLGANRIADLDSVDALNSIPRLTDIRLSENPISDPGKGGISRFALIARLAKIEVLNGSEVTPRERKESEIRYVRMVMSRLSDGEDIAKHPRFQELKRLHGIEDQRPNNSAEGPKTLSAGLLTITLKCVGASMGEKPPLTKKIPASTSVGKLKILCQSFFKLKSTKLKLFLQEEGPLPTLLDDDTTSLADVANSSNTTILMDEES